MAHEEQKGQVAQSTSTFPTTTTYICTYTFDLPERDSKEIPPVVKCTTRNRQALSFSKDKPQRTLFGYHEFLDCRNGLHALEVSRDGRERVQAVGGYVIGDSAREVVELWQGLAVGN